VKSLTERVGGSIRERNLFRRGECVLVGVSGGVDSMVLLQVLFVLAQKSGWKLVVAHFNHQLRGSSSDADERLVKRTTGELGLNFIGGRGNVKRVASQSRISVEMAARKLRHEFLARAAKNTRCKIIATAHHADDQVELFFLRLLRGAGGEGLAGMKWKSPAPFGKGLSIVRPLLNLEKSEIAEFAKREGISFRTDASNRSTDILRNRVRLELLPLLRRKFKPTVDKSVTRLMEIIGADAEVVSELARDYLKTSGGSFVGLPVAVQRRVIQEQVLRLGVLVDFDLVETLRLEPGKRISVARGIWVETDSRGRVSQSIPIRKNFSDQTCQVRLRKAGGRTSFAGVVVDWSVAPFQNRSAVKRIAGREMFDADRVGSRIVLRHWRAGDRFQPIGMKAAVKLQDLFVNQKIPAARRRGLVLAETERGEIFWVEGLRIGECCKLDAATRRALVWQWAGH
jgi:tRNA(Ile)-lysidine synthase